MADFITFSISYQTRRGTVNPHFGVEQLGFVFLNRMRSKVSRISLGDNLDK